MVSSHSLHRCKLFTCSCSTHFLKADDVTDKDISPPSLHTHTQTHPQWQMDPSCVAMVHFQDQGSIRLSLPPPLFPSVLSLTSGAYWQSDGLVGIRKISTISDHAQHISKSLPLMVHPMSSNPVYQSRYQRWLGKAHQH